MWRQALKDATFTADGRQMTMPAIKLSREDYAEIKNAMENIKGKYMMGSRFEFPFNAISLVWQISEGADFDFRKLQLFPTPDWLVKDMWEKAYHELGFRYKKGMRVLEPSAGTGSILKILLNYFNVDAIDYCEISDSYIDILETEVGKKNLPKITKVGSDFLKLKQVGYDLIFANPPFNADTKHIVKMFQLLNEDGFLITLLGYSEKKVNSLIDKFGVDAWYYEVEPHGDKQDKDTWFFEHTNSGYSLLIVQKKAKVEVKKPKSNSVKTAQETPILFEVEADAVEAKKGETKPQKRHRAVAEVATLF